MILRPTENATNAPKAYIYHLARVLERRHVLGVREKEKFVQLAQSYAQFCGVRILTYCVMVNYFEILAEVPQRPDRLPNLDELIVRLMSIASPQRVAAIRMELVALPEEERALRLESYWQRMWDLSLFMKGLKQRFSQWYNLGNGRTGPFWEDPFRRRKLIPSGSALVATAVAIDLSPVRSGAVAHRGAYRWTGYSEAMEGSETALAGYQVLMKAADGVERNPQEAFEKYQLLLLEDGT